MGMGMGMRFEMGMGMGMRSVPYSQNKTYVHCIKLNFKLL